MSGQYDLSSKNIEKLKANAKRRLELRNEFLKMTSDPFAHGHGGAVFDPAVQRFTAMRVSTYEHFKPTFTNFRYGMALIVIPFIGSMYIIKKNRDYLEDQYRTGQVAYKDRIHKYG